MTLREKMAEVKPDEIDELWIGGVLFCPCDVPEIFAESCLQEIEWKSYCPRKENGDIMNCIECWNREYIEPEVQDA